MKTKTFKVALSSLAIASTFLMTPIATYALTGTTSSGAHVNIKSDGVLSILGAEITAISGNIITVMTKFRDSVLNWNVTTNASTTILANTRPGSMADLQIGDKLSITGKLSTGANGSLTNITAIKIVDKSSMGTVKKKVGEIKSITPNSGTFVLKIDDAESKLITVQTNSSTSYKFANATSSPLLSLAVNAKVIVSGTLNADGTVMTASSVMLVPNSPEKKKLIKATMDQVKQNWKDTKNSH